MKNRQQKLLASMRAAGIDAVIITSKVNIRYYTGFTSDECAVLLTERGCYLTTDFRYTIQAIAQCGDAAEVVEANTTEAQHDVLKGLLREQCCKRCGFEQNTVSVARYESFANFPVQWKAFGNEIAAQRRIKSAGEIENLRAAQSIADKAFAQLLPKLAPGMTERDAVAELNYICAKLGSEEPAFDPIVGAGENGAMCHAIPGERAICNGNLVVFDFGCTVNGYRSDMTRTIGFGDVPEELKTIYAITLEAQQLALASVRAGISGKALDAIARDHIAAAGYGACFGHGLGHGFGLEIHEPPRAAITSENVFESGNTITIEPGIYLPDKGGVRIEDCVVVTDEGCINLVSTPKDLLIL